MVSAGLTALTSCSYDLSQAVSEQNTMKILCIGHGGGSIPLFLASKFKGRQSTGFNNDYEHKHCY
jgi:hypothetical protein